MGCVATMIFVHGQILTNYYCIASWVDLEKCLGGQPNIMSIKVAQFNVLST